MSKKIANKLEGNFHYYSLGMYVGTYEDYDITIKYDAASILYNMYLHIHNLKDVSKLNDKLNKIDKYCVAKYKNGELTITEACDSIKDMPTLVNKILKTLTDYLKKNKCHNICFKCNKDNKTSLYNHDGNIIFLCDDCYNNIINENEKQKKLNKEIKENILLGIIGSIIGSIPGLIIFIILFYLNVNPTLSILIIMLGSAYGYKWFAKGMKTGGLIISLIIGFTISILANEFNIAYTLYNEYSNLYMINIFDAYKSIPYYVANSSTFKTTYYESLIITIIFSLFGSLSNFGLYRKYIIVNKIKKLEDKDEK